MSMSRLGVEVCQFARVHSNALLVVQYKVNLLERTRHDSHKVVADCPQDGLSCLLLRKSTAETKSFNKSNIYIYIFICVQIYRSHILNICYTCMYIFMCIYIYIYILAHS